jgi:hypothetical protein
MGRDALLFAELAQQRSHLLWLGWYTTLHGRIWELNAPDMVELNLYRIKSGLSKR